MNHLLGYLLASLILSALTALVHADNRNESLVKAFSAMTSLEDGWEPLEFPDIDHHSRYQLVDDNGEQVVRATTDNSASGLIARVSVEPGDSLVLRWRWKVSNVFEQGDARKKDGDDYPARIYVAFEFEPEEAGFFERAKRKAVEVVFGEELPGNALNYIWANRLPVGEIVANPFTDTTMMVAVNSGEENSGEWVTVERDIVADYRQAFGRKPPKLAGVAIMSDSDNTGESATAWYGDIQLIRP
ncbi:DUF3047 domain-containing protein [Marinobacter orientalis]|uniref:DUF3047 domain-containing protein n=1 Tax=Marinobacter orientalis TaxID=1928859 RepID=A0A7Y0NKQ7_9GAMM|nr:DUF3047 domain-containing protein [Marinobacter orientalis]NMT62697.1 DUF3047 domain-containing protein [Marinobacter orientalis]TGX51382.1 DUF3047 domain-containing protein [Marinobacter orientalis]